jgi:hypothetical protein
VDWSNKRESIERPLTRPKHKDVMETIMSGYSSAPAAAVQDIGRHNAAMAVATTLKRWWLTYVTWRVERLAAARARRDEQRRVERQRHRAPATRVSRRVIVDTNDTESRPARNHRDTDTV